MNESFNNPLNKSEDNSMESNTTVENNTGTTPQESEGDLFENVYITQERLASSLNISMLESVANFLPNIKNPILPIYDKKAQLQLGAKYIVENKEEYFDFLAKLNGGFIILGAMMEISIITFKMNNLDIDVADDELISDPRYIHYINNDAQDFKEATDKIINPDSEVEYADIQSEILRIANEMIALVGKDSLPHLIDNIENNFNKKGQFFLNISEKLNTVDRSKGFAFSFFIESTGEEATLSFNGTDEEWEFLDPWLSMDDLKLEHKGEHYLLKDKVELLRWFNAIRSRLESECSYRTLLDFIRNTNNENNEEAERQCSIVSNEVARIIAYSKNSDSYKTRLDIISFLNGLLNKRNLKNEKVFKVLSMEDINELKNDNGVYELNLYY